MKKVNMLESYDEIVQLMMKGGKPELALIDPDSAPEVQETDKPSTGDYVYTDGSFSKDSKNPGKQLKGIALWVTDKRMITLWPDVPDETRSYAEAEKWCKENGRKLLDKDAMYAIYVNREVLKDKINLKDDCRYWIDGTETDEDGDEYHRYLYISLVFQGCYYDYDYGYTANFACQ